MKRQLLVFACAVIVAVIVLATAASAFAYDEPGTTTGTVGVSCRYCHQRWNGFSWMWQYRPADGGDCTKCHADYEFGEFTGPHANYSATSSKCDSCHDVHAASGAKLLPASTVVGSCQTCHDGTGGWGVYGTVKAVTGSDPGSGHRIDFTSVIPGGDSGTGGDATRTFRGQAGKMTCSDCHSPHGSQIVTGFPGDRSRVRAFNLASTNTARLLKRRPTGATTSTPEYGSDWCLGCHAGRSSAGTLHNHPVDSVAVRLDAFYYRRVAIAATDTPTTSTVLAPLGGIPTLLDQPDAVGRPHNATWTPSPNASGNRGYVMPYPRSADQAGHAPICQQCHEDSREVGDTDAAGRADAAPATVTAGDGVIWSSATQTWTPAAQDNPRFQNFPHETVNATMLVETNDDLCLNCHPATLLP